MSKRSPSRSLAAVALSALVLLSCSRKSDDGGSSGTSGGVDAGSFDKPALLRAFGQCALDGYREFHTAAVGLEAAARRAETEASAPSRDAAREAWKNAIDAWQRVEVFAFGPQAMSSSPGGKELRDQIYAWPIAPGRCLIEQQIVEKTYDTPAFPTSLVSTRTLASSEFLQFYEGADNACAPTASINTSGKWAALGADEIARRKASYARAISVETVLRAQELVDAWDPGKGNFLAELAGAGTAKTYATQQMAFNAVSDALFYGDDEVKDMKIGIPAGLSLGCTTTPPCLDRVESPWAKRSKVHIKNNLVGMGRLIQGCGANGEGLGFDDLLRAVGAGAVADKLAAGLAGAHAALDALKEPSFEEDLVKNPAGVKALFEALRALMVVMKTEFITVLDLEIPKKIEGDND